LFAEEFWRFRAEQRFLRWPRYNFRSLPQDRLCPLPTLRDSFFLRSGNRMTAKIRPPRDREKFMTIEQVLTIEGIELLMEGKNDGF